MFLFIAGSQCVVSSAFLFFFFAFTKSKWKCAVSALAFDTLSRPGVWREYEDKHRHSSTWMMMRPAWTMTRPARSISRTQIVSARSLARVRRQRSPLLYLDDDETGLDDDEMRKINFKNSNCLGQEFGESMKTQIAIPPLGR